MRWHEFEPFVLPHVIGVPIPTLEFHARFAAIDFCRRTHCHIRTLEAVATDGQTHEIELEAPNRDLQITKVYATSVDGRPWHLASTSMGLAMARTQSTEDFAFTQDNRVLMVYPLQPQGAQVQVDAALIPSATSTKLEPDVASVYADDIAHGIIARLQSIPKQEFTDLSMAAVNQQRFKDRIATVAMKVQRGLLEGQMPRRSNFL